MSLHFLTCFLGLIFHRSDDDTEFNANQDREFVFKFTLVCLRSQLLDKRLIAAKEISSFCASAFQRHQLMNNGNAGN